MLSNHIAVSLGDKAQIFWAEKSCFINFNVVAIGILKGLDEFFGNRSLRFIRYGI